MADKYSAARQAISSNAITPVKDRLRSRERTDSQLRKQTVATYARQYVDDYKTVATNIKNLRTFMFEALDSGDEIDVQRIRKYVKLDYREVATLRNRFREIEEEITNAKVQKIITRLTVLKGLLWRLSTITYIPSYVNKYRTEIDQTLDLTKPLQVVDFYKNKEEHEDPYTSDDEFEPVVHFSNMNYYDTFSPGDDFATIADPYDQQQQEEDEDNKTPPRSSMAKGVEETDIRNVARKTAEEIQSDMNKRFRSSKEPENNTPRIKTKVADRIKRKLSMDKQRLKFIEAESDGNQHNTDDNESDTDNQLQSYQLPKKRRNDIGSTAPAKKLARAFENIAQVSDSSEIRDAVQCLVDQFNEKFESISPKKKMPQSSLPPGFHGPRRTDLDSSKIDFWKHVKSVDLEKFTGQDDKKPFASWWRLFDHEINRLPEPFSSDILKLRALYKLLDGEAQDLVRPYHTSTNPKSYIAAVKLLQSRYGSSKKTKENVKDKLRKLTPTASTCTAQVEFLNKILEIRADLEIAGESIKEASRQCIEVALRKMSTKYAERYYISLSLNTKEERETFYEKDPATELEELVLWINNLKAENYSSDEEETKTKPQEDSTVTAFLTYKEKNHQSPAKPKTVKSFRCPICRTDAHPWATCPVPPADRRQKIKERGWCNNCLKEGHVSKDCTSEITCYHCMLDGKWMRHHSSLCYSLEHKPSREKVPINWGLYKSKKKETDPSSTNKEAKRPDRNARYRKFKEKARKLPSDVRNVFSTLLELNSDYSPLSSEAEEPAQEKSETEEEGNTKKPESPKVKQKGDKGKKQ